jgi:glucan phosphoethanolaminetransferase (alkaline phosphatase superfamily)
VASQHEFHATNGYPETPEVEAGAGWRLLHLLLALAGWVLFVYWWLIVFRRVTPGEIRFTLIFLAVAAAVIVLVTAFWVFHNKSMFRRRNLRLRAIESSNAVKHDSIGRRVRFAESRDILAESALVRVQMEAGEKVYYHGLLEISR